MFQAFHWIITALFTRPNSFVMAFKDSKIETLISLIDIVFIDLTVFRIYIIMYRKIQKVEKGLIKWNNSIKQWG